MQLPCTRHSVVLGMQCPVVQQRLPPQACSNDSRAPAKYQLSRTRTRAGHMVPSQAQSSVQELPAPVAPEAANKTLLCTSVTAATFQEALKDIESIAQAGADIIELRLDLLTDFIVEQHLEKLLKTTTVPKLVTMRPVWEGGKYEGPEPARLAVLKFAAHLGASHVDVELKAAPYFFAGGGETPVHTKIVLSSHNYENTPSDAALDSILDQMWKQGADIAKIATTATDITDCARLLTLFKTSQGPCIALCMGERGQPSRMLAAKYGGYLTFGALRGGAESAPGQPTLHQLQHQYHLPSLTPECKVYGVIGNPVAHSRSPQLHNAAMAAAGLDSIYMPLLVDNLRKFLDIYNGPDYKGFSVTIPHKLAALECADEVDPVAQQIGAVNTLVRQQDGTLKGYNTDWSAAISAIERGLSSDEATSSSAASAESSGAAPAVDLGAEEATTSGRTYEEGQTQTHSPLKGRTVVVIGAGGAGRALAFGAAHKGAKVIIANRSIQRAQELAAQIEGEVRVVALEELNQGKVQGDVLANTTSIGMHPDVAASPVAASALQQYELVFDAVYTPMATQLLKDAEKAGCRTVSGLEMFIGQAAEQFELFTGHAAPVQLMRDVVLKSLSS